MTKDSKQRRIYLLDPRRYGAETIAVTFAKTSRSPLSFRAIAEELTDARAAEFHEKWVVGYGHASVAEHAVLHLAFENISRLAVECLQSNRLGSYTEKSTRYQEWDQDGYCCPAELENHPLLEVFQSTNRMLFSLYGSLIQPAMEHVAGLKPEMSERNLRSEAIDSIRYLLPAAALANVGLTANARVLAHALRKMLSHPLEEVRTMGAEALQVALQEAPTLVRYVDAIPYWEQTRAFQRRESEKLGNHERPALAAKRAPAVTLIQADSEAENTILAAILYASGDRRYSEVQEIVHRLPADEKLRLLMGWAEDRTRHDALLREAEMAVYTFELTMDQGAYYEFKRHRMMTQIPQPLTAHLGYEVPLLIEEMGAGSQYRTAMEQAGEAYVNLETWNPDVASYLVPNGFRRRVLIQINLRQLAHLCELRATDMAHFAIREVALGMVEAVREVHPHLARLVRIPSEWTSGELAADSFFRGDPE